MCPIADNEEEWDRLNAFLENADDATAKSFLHENWKRIFDIEPFKNEWTTRGEDVQATFWELKREYVKKARPFVTVSKKDTDIRTVWKMRGRRKHILFFLLPKTRQNQAPFEQTAFGDC